MSSMGNQTATLAPRRRRWLLWSGSALVLAGLGMLAYVGWQMYVTNWLSQREQSAIVDELELQWDKLDKGEGGSAAIEVDAGQAGAIVTIPRFGDDYAVPVLEGIEDDALAAGIGHFPGTADPGQKGNFALAGHRVTHGEPLRDMPSLEAGDEIVVTTRETIYTYVLDTPGDGLNVPFTEGWVVTDKPVNPDPGEPTADLDEKRLITLTTCSELFHTDGRLIAFGHLVSAKPRT